MIRRFLSAALAAPILITSLLAATPAEAEDPDPMTGAPAVGQCYKMSATQANDLKSAPADSVVNCRTTHTMWIFAVGEVAPDLDLSVPADVSKAYAAVCDTRKASRFFRYPSVAYAKTPYYFGYTFIPTDDEIAAGAHWIACASALAGQKGFYANKLRTAANVDSTMPKAFQLCATGQYRWISCAARHAYHVTYAAKVDKKPTDANIQQAQRAACPKHVPRGSRYVYGARIQLKSSFYLVCLKKSTR